MTGFELPEDFVRQALRHAATLVPVSGHPMVSKSRLSGVLWAVNYLDSLADSDPLLAEVQEPLLVALQAFGVAEPPQCPREIRDYVDRWQSP